MASKVLRLEQHKSLPDLAILEPQDVLHQGSAFPKDFDHSGWLDIRTRPTKPWKRRYFVLANNFLLCGITPHAKNLERVIPLEGSNVKSTIRVSNMTFEILHRRRRHHFRAGNSKECNIWTEKIARASRLKIKDVYQFQDLLGQNWDNSTQVWAARHRARGDEVAIKIISKRKYDPKALQNEVLILKRLDHPNVVKLYDLFETKNNVYLVMEKCLGGELFEQIVAQDGAGFCEKDCITIIHQIAKAVKYMHGMGIVHRDLKPENILCVNQNSIKFVKVADFGISKVLFDPEQRRKDKQKAKQQIAKAKAKAKQQKLQNNNNEEMKINDHRSRRNNNPKSRQHRPVIDPLKNTHGVPRGYGQNGSHHKVDDSFDDYKRIEMNYKQNKTMTTMCGTISYTAPEILRELPYDKSVDYWSLGVIMYILLCGYPPFAGESEREVARSILEDTVELEPEHWEHVSDQGKNLVLGLVDKNPKSRLTCDDIIKHCWIHMNSAKKSISEHARASLIKTVVKRGIRKMSFGAFEGNSKHLNKIYRSRDDSLSGSRLSISSSTSLGQLGSKTDEQLFELRIPSSYGLPTLKRKQSRASNSAKQSEIEIVTLGPDINSTFGKLLNQSKVIRNPMIIMIGNHSGNNNNSNNIGKDIQCMYELFCNVYNYKNYVSIVYNGKQLKIDNIEKNSVKYLSNVSDFNKYLQKQYELYNKKQHSIDGIIFYYTGYAVNNSILFNNNNSNSRNNNNLLDIESIKRTLIYGRANRTSVISTSGSSENNMISMNISGVNSNNNGSYIEHIPKIFIFDGKSNNNMNSMNSNKNGLLNKQFNRFSNIATIYSNAECYEMVDNSNNVSYLTNGIYNVLSDKKCNQMSWRSLVVRIRRNVKKYAMKQQQNGQNGQNGQSKNVPLVEFSDMLDSVVFFARNNQK